jgi:hypothetical protein
MDEDHLFGGIKMGKDSVKGPQFVRYFQPVINALIALGGSGRPEAPAHALVPETVGAPLV